MCCEQNATLAPGDEPSCFSPLASQGPGPNIPR